MEQINSNTDSVTEQEAFKVLVIEDDRGDFLLIQDLLRSVHNRKFQLDWAPNSREGLKGMISNEYDLHLLDFRLGADDGLDLLREAIGQGCDRPVILLTGFGDYQLDLAAMSSGAVDFLVKDKIEAPLLERSIRYAIEHWRAKQRLEVSLHEKAILLKEVHHRVKNNLQVITSMLKLQEDKCQSSQIAQVLQVCRDRIRSIALIHQQLYGSMHLGSIDFTEYCRNLLNGLLQSYGVDQSRISATVEGDPLRISVTTGVPAGLLLHELVSNSLKHAFPDSRSGEIRIQFRKISDGEFSLSVADNGVGLPPESAMKEKHSLGFELIETLTSQLQGTLHIRRKEGTEFEILFPNLQD